MGIRKGYCPLSRGAGTEFPTFAGFFPRPRRHILLRRGGIAMMKNDYRRALIMLRALEPGLSGYVRL